jgi:uracil phosphoribosyltransferase
MGKVYVFDHPLIQHKMALLRDKRTSTKDFRELVNEVGLLMGFEATRDLELEEHDIETPICPTKAMMLPSISIAIVPILRAGLGLVDGLMRLIPNAKVGHIGLYRDETTHEPVEYYCKLPADAQERILIVVDPMLATGGSASDAISMIKKRGAKQIKLCCLVSAPEGIRRILKDHPDVDLYVAAVDRQLNENCYIMPGLGDAGDRLFGTK